MTGRQLFQITLGTTLILNPNRRYCIFYPEEVRLLLDGKTLAPIQQISTEQAGPLDLAPITAPPDGLVASLCELYRGIPGVESAALAERAKSDESLLGVAMIIVVVSVADAERVVRATGAVLAEKASLVSAFVDVATLRPEEPNPWSMLPNFYVRSRSPTDGALH